LIAVGGGYGTITEMAYGLHYDRPVFALPSAPVVPRRRALRGCRCCFVKDRQCIFGAGCELIGAAIFVFANVIKLTFV